MAFRVQFRPANRDASYYSSTGPYFTTQGAANAWASANYGSNYVTRVVTQSAPTGHIVSGDRYVAPPPPAPTQPAPSPAPAPPPVNVPDATALDGRRFSQLSEGDRANWIANHGAGGAAAAWSREHNNSLLNVGDATARDGRRFSQMSESERWTWISTHGGNAANVWQREHEAGLPPPAAPAQPAPAPSQPAPAPTQPAPSQPAPSQPAPSQPAPTQPTQPTPAQPSRPPTEQPAPLTPWRPVEAWPQTGPGRHQIYVNNQTGQFRVGEEGGPTFGSLVDARAHIDSLTPTTPTPETPGTGPEEPGTTPTTPATPTNPDGTPIFDWEQRFNDLLEQINQLIGTIGDYEPPELDFTMPDFGLGQLQRELALRQTTPNLGRSRSQRALAAIFQNDPAFIQFASGSDLPVTDVQGLLDAFLAANPDFGDPTDVATERGYIPPPAPRTVEELIQGNVLQQLQGSGLFGPDLIGRINTQLGQRADAIDTGEPLPPFESLPDQGGGRFLPKIPSMQLFNQRFTGADRAGVYQLFEGLGIPAELLNQEIARYAPPGGTSGGAARQLFRSPRRGATALLGG